VDELVEIEVARHYLKTCTTTLVGTAVAVGILVYTLHQSAEPAVLGLWALAVGAIIAARARWVQQYNAQGRAAAPGPVAKRIADLHTRPTFFNALLWGVICWMVDYASRPQDAFAVNLVIVGVTGVTVYTLGPYRVAYTRFIHTTMALCVAAAAYAITQSPSDTLPWATLLLLGTFWALIIKLGADYREIVRTSLRLRIEKDQLIESLREQTRRAQVATQTKARFLASAGHDLRQPVHALSLYADWLDQEPEMAKEIIPKIRKSTQAVNTLFDSLFDMARLDSGAMQPTKEPVYLPDLLDALLLEFSPASAEKGLELRIRGDEATIETDPVWLRRIASNLLSNAIRYTDTGGVLVALRVRGHGPQAEARLEFWDTGRGIPADDQGRVFDEFYRSGAARGSEQGFGLGLAIVSRLSQTLGFRLHLHSRERRGTVIRLDLGPVVSRHDSDSTLNPSGILGQARLWVLEPSSHRALGLRRVFARHGLNTRVETDPAAFFRDAGGAQDNKPGADTPEVLVAPLDPDNLTGWPATLHTVREAHPECPCVLAAAQVTAELRQHWAKHNVVLTTYPLRLDAVLTACADAFAQKHAQADS
jgi:signal transduction histidine kinase